MSFSGFLILHLVPGELAEIMAAQAQAGPEAVRQIRHQLGLDLPFHVQHARLLWKALHGEFARSYYTSRPVFQSVLDMLPVTRAVRRTGLIQTAECQASVCARSRGLAARA